MRSPCTVRQVTCRHHMLACKQPPEAACSCALACLLLSAVQAACRRPNAAQQASISPTIRLGRGGDARLQPDRGDITTDSAHSTMSALQSSSLTQSMQARLCITTKGPMAQ